MDKEVNANFEFDLDSEGYPVNKFKCHFFKVGSEAENLSGKSLGTKEKAYCSIRGEILEDYKICCTKHDGGISDNKQHCQSFKKKLGNMSTSERLRIEELRFMKDNQRRQDWRQTVISQHSLHATLAGLQVTALILFVTFYGESIFLYQDILFTFAIVAILIQVYCLVSISEHERRDAWNSANVTDEERNKENLLRSWLNYATIFSIIFISFLLTLSILFKLA